MYLSKTRPRPHLATKALLAGTAALGALAVINTLIAHRTEQEHPPQGSFLDIDGVRLHYTDRGKGSPVLLVHGNAVSGDDFDISGVSDLLLQNHRVIIIDRPGFGHSARPRNRDWSAAEQAELLLAALQRLGVERPVVVGHSWGAIVTLAMAVQHPDRLAGIVLIGGYYFPSTRMDVMAATIGTIPVIGDVANHTTTPLVGRLVMPLFKRALFAPAEVTPRFQEEYSESMVLRPSAVRASSMDGAQMIPGVLALQDRYKALDLPVEIIAGAGDKVVLKEGAEQLHREIRGSKLHLIEGAGHMVHHVAPETVASAVKRVASASSGDRQPE